MGISIVGKAWECKHKNWPLRSTGQGFNPSLRKNSNVDNDFWKNLMVFKKDSPFYFWVFDWPSCPLKSMVISLLLKIGLELHMFSSKNLSIIFKSLDTFYLICSSHVLTEPVAPEANVRCHFNSNFAKMNQRLMVKCRHSEPRSVWYMYIYPEIKILKLA